MRATALKNALDILEMVRRESCVRNRDLLNKIGVSPPTLSAILGELTARDYLRKTAEGYRLGYAFLGMSAALQEDLDIRTICAPALDTLMRKTGETLELAVPDNLSVVFIDKREAPETIRLNAALGRQYGDLHCHAVGKVLLAWGPGGILERYLAIGPLVARTKTTISDPDQLRHGIDIIRKEGIAFDYGENREDLVRISAPVFSADGILAAVLGIAAPAYRTDADRAAELSQILKERACALSATLGYQKPYPGKSDREI